MPARSPAHDPVAELLALPRFGSGPGLARMLELCAELRQRPWLRRLDAIKVAGSNGKGSVCAMVASILGQLGVGHGLYTSPHFLDFEERVTVDGEPIAPRQLAAAVDWLRGRRASYRAAHPSEAIGFFEATTAAALHHFAAREPETVVAEAGLGGRFDPTRALPGSVTALTALDLEHTALLGETLVEIAREKAALAQRGSTLVVGHVDAEALQALEHHCRSREVRLLAAGEASTIGRIEMAGERQRVDLEAADLHLPDLEIALLGEHQAANAAVAALVVREWLERHRPDLARIELEAAVRRGLAGVACPGRFERLHRDPDVFVDVGHTPGAVRAIARTVRQALGEQPVLLVLGISADKDAEAIVDPLLEVAGRVICTRARHRGAEARELAALVRRRKPAVAVATEETVESAMTHAVETAEAEGMAVLVAGGLFVAAEAAAVLRGRDPAELRFL